MHLFCLMFSVFFTEYALHSYHNRTMYCLCTLLIPYIVAVIYSLLQVWFQNRRSRMRRQEKRRVEREKKQKAATTEAAEQEPDCKRLKLGDSSAAFFRNTVSAPPTVAPFVNSLNAGNRAAQSQTGTCSELR